MNVHRKGAKSGKSAKESENKMRFSFSVALFFLCALCAFAVKVI